MYKIEIRTLPISEPNTKSMQANIQISMAVSPSAFGELVVMLLKMLIKTRNNVMSNAIRPEIKSGYITNCNIWARGSRPATLGTQMDHSMWNQTEHNSVSWHLSTPFAVDSENFA